MPPHNWTPLHKKYMIEALIQYKSFMQVWKDLRDPIVAALHGFTPLPATYSYWQLRKKLTDKVIDHINAIKAKDNKRANLNAVYIAEVKRLQKLSEIIDGDTTEDKDRIAAMKEIRAILNEPHWIKAMQLSGATVRPPETKAEVESLISILQHISTNFKE